MTLELVVGCGYALGGAGRDLQALDCRERERESILSLVLSQRILVVEIGVLSC